MEHGTIVLPNHYASDDNEQPASPLRKTIAVASIAAGIQFGWALQLSLLTPYVQTLGVPHMWVSFIWLCGPLSGLLVQPLVGYFSDRCGAKFGRRTPFIVSGAVFVCIAVTLIGFAAEIGVQTGDSATSLSKPRAVAIFVVGFWVLDVANNMLQGPCRALLADMSGGNHAKMRTANAFFSFFMAVGNVLGYAAGSYEKLYKILHFSLKTECDAACANLKTCFIFSVCLLILVTVMALTNVREKRYIISKDGEEGDIHFFSQLVASLKTLEKPMWLLLLVTALNWIAWFPWLLYDTDWMGREIFGGDTKGTPRQKDLYERGVHYGSLGLLINSVVLALFSLALEPLSRLMRGAKNLWGLVNIILAVCLAMTAVVSHMAKEHRDGATVPPSSSVKAAALTLFAFMGIPLSVTFSVPFALASIYCSSSGGGQGLSLGVLNLSIVIPQMLVSASSGTLDKALGGGGNLPAFIIGAIVAAISAFCAIFLLPNPPKQQSAEDNSV